VKSAEKLPAVLATRTATVATAVATATITTAAAATGTRGALFARAGFVDRKVTAIHVLSVQCGHSGISAFLGFHGDKAETARAAAEFVHDQIDAGDRAMLAKEVLELIFRGVIRQISDVEFSTHDDLLCFVDRLLLPRLFPTIGFQIITENTFN
jgi:hypothetical protein